MSTSTTTRPTGDGRSDRAQAPPHRGALGEVIRGRRLLLDHTRARRRQVWAVIKEVPADVKRAEVAQALEDVGLAERYQAGLAGALTLSPRPAGPNQPARTSTRGAATRSVGTSSCSEFKRLTVEVPGRLHAAMSRRARPREHLANPLGPRGPRGGRIGGREALSCQQCELEQELRGPELGLTQVFVRAGNGNVELVVQLPRARRRARAYAAPRRAGAPRARPPRLRPVRRAAAVRPDWGAGAAL